jgi:hypothetical protein
MFTVILGMSDGTTHTMDVDTSSTVATVLKDLEKKIGCFWPELFASLPDSTKCLAIRTKLSSLVEESSMTVRLNVFKQPLPKPDRIFRCSCCIFPDDGKLCRDAPVGICHREACKYFRNLMKLRIQAQGGYEEALDEISLKQSRLGLLVDTLPDVPLKTACKSMVGLGGLEPYIRELWSGEYQTHRQDVYFRPSRQIGFSGELRVDFSAKRHGMHSSYWLKSHELEFHANNEFDIATPLNRKSVDAPSGELYERLNNDETFNVFEEGYPYGRVGTIHRAKDFVHRVELSAIQRRLRETDEIRLREAAGHPQFVIRVKFRRNSTFVSEMERALLLQKA